MTATTPPGERAGRQLGSRPSLDTLEARPAIAVKWFAWIGAIFVVFILYQLVRWLASGPTPTPVGPTPVPGYMKAAAWVLQIGAPAGAVILFWTTVVRPWRRNGKPSMDGLLWVGFLTLIWQDCFVNYSQELFTYNSYYVNWGSWVNYIPGWNATLSDRYVEPLLVTGVFYIVFAYAGVVLACFLMRKAKARWPRLGTMGLIGVSFLTLVILDLVAEPIFTFFGVWVYGSVHDGFGLFAGHYYQFPLYEPLLWGLAWTGMACLRYFTNDRGESLVERGIDQVRAGGKTKAGMRFLAVTAALNIIYLVCCNIPYSWIGTHQVPWPEDITSRSYFNQGLCAPYSNYTCPGGDTPIFRPDGTYLTPDGKVIKP